MTCHESPRPMRHSALEIAGIGHGFFGRDGGVSDGVYASLNAGLGSNDEPMLVIENRARIAFALGVENDRLISPYQFHSADVVAVDAPFKSDRPRADAIVTATPGLAVGVVTADCGPLLFADVSAGVVGAAHAGWQGAVSGVIENTIVAMENRGAKRSDIVAVLGPMISQKNYEVGADFEAKILAKDQSASVFFVTGQSADKRQFDLPGYIMMRLLHAGVNGVDLGLCTYSNPERFFSFRRTTHKQEVDYGRQMSAICLE
jgi:polyphenol oxidase